MAHAIIAPLRAIKKWLDEELSEEEYKTILDSEMPSEELNCIPVYTIRSPKMRPDGKSKSDYYEWDNLPELK
jgi:hypothetical protein